MAFQTRVDTEAMSPGLARKYVRGDKERRMAMAMPEAGSSVNDFADCRSTMGKNRARTVEGAAAAARNMHNVDPAEREAMRAKYDAWWAEQMAKPARAKTPPQPKRKSKGKKGKGKKGKKAGGSLTQKKRKSFFSLF
jgi:hypothetical protein